MKPGESVPVVSFVGKSGVGKTTALELVIRELKRRGRRVGTVKHDAHGFDMDKPGKDSWRHAEAGSDAVAVSGPHKMALIRRLDEEMALDDIVRLMGDVEIVLTEGYKRGRQTQGRGDAPGAWHRAVVPGRRTGGDHGRLSGGDARAAICSGRRCRRRRST